MNHLNKERLGYFDKGIIEKRGIYIHTPSEFTKRNLMPILWSARLTCEPPYELLRENVEFYQSIYSILCISEGSMHFDYEGLQFKATEGDMVFLYSGYKNHYWTEEKTTFEFIHFSGELASNYYHFLTHLNGPLFQNYGNMSYLFSSVLDELEKDVPNDHVLSAYLLTIISSLTKKQSIVHPIVAKATHYMQLNYHKKISLEGISDYVGLSKFYFSRLFKQEIGISPHQYLIQLRIKQAKKELIETNESVESISFNAGFSTPSHFIDTFKKNIQMTPHQFREMFIQGP